MMKTFHKTLLAAVLLMAAHTCMPAPASAQNLALSTNLAGYANFGTLNLEASYAVAQHWSVTAGMRYNPFTFPGGVEDGPQQFRQRACSLGTRYWPWHIYSGWWMAAKAQYQEYNMGGITSLDTQEGDRFGGGVSGGYTYMLGPHFNVEAGAGIWGGLDRYARYACPSCGRTLERGNKKFLMLNEVLLSLTYVF